MDDYGTQKKNFYPLVLAAGLIGIVLLLLGSFELPGELQAQKEYETAPGCVDGGIKDTALPACQTITMKVVDKHSELENHQHYWYVDLMDSSSSYEARFRSDGGTMPESSSIYDSVAIGDRIPTKLWQGHVIPLSDSKGHSTSTMDAPDVGVNGGAYSILYMGGFITALSVVSFFIVRATRSAQT